MNKKLIIISPAYPLRGGIADSTHLLALALKKIGIDLFIISYKLQYPSIFFPGKTQFVQNERKPDLNIIPIINSINPFSWLKTINFIRSINPDIILTRFWIPFFSPALSTILKFTYLKNKIPLVALCDNILPHEKRLGDKLLINSFLKNNTHFLVMSKSVKIDLYKFINSDNVLYHPHPIYSNFGNLLDKQTAINKLGLESTYNYILFFGYIRKYKGLDILINSLIYLPSNVKLIIAGEFYDDYNKYIRIIDKLKLSKRIIIFSKFIEKNKVNLFFSACDLVVQPYIKATQSGVAQIAFHFNKPIISTNVGGLSEYIVHGKHGYLVEPNPKKISESILEFYNFHKENQFSNNIKLFKNKFTWNSMAKMLISLINN